MTSEALLASNAVTSTAVIAGILLILLQYVFGSRDIKKPVTRSPDTSPPELCWSTRKIAHSFFTTPFDFLAEGSRATESKVFRFLLDKNGAIVVSGEEARRTFFGEKALNLYQGFQALIGTIPTGLNPQALHGIYKRLNVLQKPDNLQHLIPQLLADCHRKMDSWDNLVIDPCSTVHGVTFQMIVRAVTSHDVAEDPRLVSRLKYFYDVIDASVKPSTSWPWVPSLATLHKLRASMFVYSTFRQAVKQRVRNGVRRDDTLQQLLDSGESTQCITGFMMGLPIAGARSTGTIGTWLLLFLAHEPIWSRAVRTEIEALLGLPTTTITTTTKPRETIPPTMMSREQIQTALSAVPLAAWESQTPRLDLCIRETLRRAQPHMAVRRNTGPDLSIGGFTIPSAAFVLYPFSDVALDPNLYPDPLRWDPARPIVDRDAFLGWGGGTHLCKGQRLATLILKIVVAYALICYEISLVGSDAALSSDGPVPDWNDYLTCRPRGDCTLRFRRRRK